MNQQELQQFLEKAASGDYTNEEYKAFTYWMDNCSREEYKQMLICWERVIDSDKSFDSLDNSLIKKIEIGLDRIDERSPVQNRLIFPEVERQRSLWPRIVVAASILLFLSIGVYFFYQKKQVIQQTAQNQAHDITPGGNKAILTLANGQKIVLDNVKNGVIANQGNTDVSKKQDGQLVYKMAQTSIVNAGAEAYDTLTTPRAGIYHITLTDGSKVWLNAATSIRYPATFTGKYRTVDLLYGEAYYEVNHNDKMPFRVIVEGQTIEDIGTFFNINAYKDELAVKTTLLEGSIRISEGNETAILKPGQQSQINTNGIDQRIHLINDVDTDEIIAWKNGFFQFTNANIQTIMRQLTRWYDVQVVYEGPVSKHLFTGDIHRDIKASEAMQILTFLKIDYRIAGKKIIISNQNQ